MPGYRVYIEPWAARVLARIAEEQRVPTDELIARAAEEAALRASTIAEREERNKPNANT